MGQHLVILDSQASHFQLVTVIDRVMLIPALVVVVIPALVVASPEVRPNQVVIAPSVHTKILAARFTQMIAPQVYSPV